MKKAANPKVLLIISIVAGLAFVLQIAGLVRYIVRLPGDYVGIVLYSITAVAFAVIAAGFYIQWKQQKK